MKYVLKALVITAALSAIVVAPGLADEFVNLKTISEDPKKVAGQVWFGPTWPQLKQLKSIGLPKRVGLISFYIWDSGTTEHNAMDYTYDESFEKSIELDDRGVNFFSTEFAAEGIPILKSKFKASGMNLQIPIEFLDTDEKKQAYRDFTLPESGWRKIGAVRRWLEENPTASGAADGFQPIPLHLLAATDRELLAALVTLGESLGLDALAVVGHTVKSGPDVAVLGKVVVQVFGPNPLPKPTSETAARYWSSMIPYVEGHFGRGFRGAQIMDWNGEEGPQSDLDGYGTVLGAIAEGTLDRLESVHDSSR